MPEQIYAVEELFEQTPEQLQKLRNTLLSREQTEADRSRKS